MSLRARLLIGLVTLAAVGLGAAAVATYEEQRSFLTNRLDQEVAQSRIPVAIALNVGRPERSTAKGSVSEPPVAKRANPTLQASETYAELLGASGKVLEVKAFTSYGQTAPSAPALPIHLATSRTGSSHVQVFTLRSRSGSAQYRAAAFTVSGGRTLVVAVPLRDVEQTLQRLIVVESLVGAGVILALVALGWGVIRIGLQPLERIGKVAAEIARGDLSQRVSRDDQRTEVGRLGNALNEMMVQIEQAFADRSASEDRLRRFLADASHELRTPLVSIRGYAELFRIGATSDAHSLDLAMSRIEAEANRMGGLVEDLLTLARLDELPRSEPVLVNLNALAEHAVHDTRAIAPNRRVSLDADERVEVVGDPGQLHQVLANLTRNAVIHTGDGVAIEVEVHRRDRAAVITVRDHGAGLPDGAGEQVFDRFWRSGIGRSRGPGGAGLGLAIVQGVVTAHGGRVSAVNAPDGGALFRVELPLASVALPPADSPVEPEPVSP